MIVNQYGNPSDRVSYGGGDNVRGNLGELRGKVTVQRILPLDSAHPKCETSFEISGTILGVQATVMRPYWSIVRQDGTLYGECPWQAIIMTKEGKMGTW